MDITVSWKGMSDCDKAAMNKPELGYIRTHLGSELAQSMFGETLAHIDHNLYDKGSMIRTATLYQRYIYRGHGTYPKDDILKFLAFVRETEARIGKPLRFHNSY